MNTTLPAPFRGIVPPMVTPLSGPDELDVEGLERVVEHIIAGGVHGLFILGTTGEGPSLSYKLRMELIERVCRLVAGRVAVLVGITDTSFSESVDLAHYAHDEGADAVVLAAPYYFPARQEDLLRYIQHIAAELPLPIFLYNMPSHTKLAFEVDLLKQAMQIPNIVGLKDSSGQFVYFQSVQQAARAAARIHLLGRAGGDVGCDDSVRWPRRRPRRRQPLPAACMLRLWEAATAGDLETTRRLHAQTIRISTSLYCVGNYGTGITKAIKAALACLGICGTTSGRAVPSPRRGRTGLASAKSWTKLRHPTSRKSVP